MSKGFKDFSRPRTPPCSGVALTNFMGHARGFIGGGTKHLWGPESRASYSFLKLATSLASGLQSTLRYYKTTVFPITSDIGMIVRNRHEMSLATGLCYT